MLSGLSCWVEKHAEYGEEENSVWVLFCLISTPLALPITFHFVYNGEVPWMGRLIRKQTLGPRLIKCCSILCGCIESSCEKDSRCLATFGLVLLSFIKTFTRTTQLPHSPCTAHLSLPRHCLLCFHITFARCFYY